MINITLKQAKMIVDAFGGDEDGVASLSKGEGHEGKGLYLGWAGYEDEGSEYLGEEQ